MGYEGLSPAEVYDQGVVPTIFGEWTPALVAEVKPATGERALDLACGSGVVARTVASLVGTDGSVVGVDLNPAMLAVAASHELPAGSAPIEWQQGSAESLALPDDDVDLVLCQQGFQFFPDRPGAMAEVARVLRSAGRLALSVWAPLERNPMQDAFNQSLLEHTGAAIFSVPFSFNDAGAVEELVREAGFVSVSVEEQTRTAHFESVRQFAEVHVIGAAAVIPAMAELDDDTRRSIIEATVTDLTPAAEPYLSSDGFNFPMTSVVATARKP